MASLAAVVLGTGHLGSRHAERLAEASGFDLTAVYDQNPFRAREVAERLGCTAAESPDAAVAAADVVVVATSTSSHHESARQALDAGKPVLVEKPLTGRVEEAEDLVRTAEEKGLVLHVGHVERFNPSLRRLLGNIPAPLFVESHRLASLVPRNLDINVVQDLMVHDLDLAIAFVGEDPVAIEAVGVPVLTERVDIANARIRFPGGAVANLTASRVSLERVRKFRMFLPGAYISADCAAREGHVYRLKEGHEGEIQKSIRSGNPVEMARLLDHHLEGREAEDALTAEHEAFRKAVLEETSEGVTGQEALRTLRAMVAVEEAITRGEP
jgi:predicted dehydrogenase